MDVAIGVWISCRDFPLLAMSWSAPPLIVDLSHGRRSCPLMQVRVGNGECIVGSG